MNRSHRMRLARILIALALFVAALILGASLELPWLVSLGIMAVPFLIAGWDVLFDAARKLFTGQMFDEKLLMTVASVGAFALCFIEKDAESAHEAAAVMIFYQTGELFSDIAVGKSRKSVKKLLEMMPSFACVERNGEILTVSPEEIAVGEIVVVRPGEKIPVDGEVIEGGGTLDTAPLTGESVPREVQIGEPVLSGCINLTGVLRVRADKPFSDSTVSRIMELVENSAMQKTTSEKFISRFARVYTPLVTLAALLLAVLPPVVVGAVTGNWSFSETFRPYVHAGLMFLIVSCPCALVISVPLGFFAAIGAAGRKGVLFKGSVYLEQLSKTGVVLFDKTGTLTRGEFAVDRVIPADGVSRDELLLLAASVERYSNHPVARAVASFPEDRLPEAADFEEVPGKGAKAVVDGKTVCVGNRRMMEESSAVLPPDLPDGSVVFVSVDGVYSGAITVCDTYKEDAARAVAELHELGVRCIMLTGDRRAPALKAARDLGIDEVEAELLPQDKVAIAKRRMSEKKKNESVVFVGDGINDAPVLTCVDVGAAMGALGSDAAIEASDVVLAGDRPSDLPLAIRISRKAMRLSKENIVFALAVKGAILLLLALMTFLPALSGLDAYAGEFAVFADVGVSVLAVLNAMRAGRQ